MVALGFESGCNVVALPREAVVGLGIREFIPTHGLR
jgi:hypothetical protein